MSERVKRNQVNVLELQSTLQVNPLTQMNQLFTSKSINCTPH